MKSAVDSQFIQFLENDLSLSRESILLALKHDDDDFCLLPVVLWQYGLVTLDQVNFMFDWLEKR